MSIESNSKYSITYDTIKWTLGHLTIGAKITLNVTSEALSCAKKVLNFGINDIEPQSSEKELSKSSERSPHPVQKLIQPKVLSSNSNNHSDLTFTNLAINQNMVPQSIKELTYPGLTQAVLHQLYYLEKNPNDESKNILKPKEDSNIIICTQEKITNTDINRLIQTARDNELLPSDPEDLNQQNRGGSYTSLTGLVLNEFYKIENNKLSPKNK
jgi:hypothetical protein